VPRYDYACTACDHRFEAVQSFIDDPLTECPVCGGRLRKLISPVGVVFKGSGFYRNDSRPKESVASADGGSEKSDSKADSKSDSKVDAKKDSKSDAKSETKSDSNVASRSDSLTPAAAAPSGSSTASKTA